MKRRTPFLFVLWVALVASTAVGQGAPADADHDADHGHGPAGVRLLVASFDGPELLVLDAADGDVVGRFTVPAAARVVELPDAQLAVALHRDANRVTFVHSGLTTIDHGDHVDVLPGPPYVLATVNLGRLPSHAVAQGDDIAVLHDGRVAWLDARLLGVSLDYVDVAGAGIRAVALLDGHLVVVDDDAAVHVHDRTGRRVATVGACVEPGGQAVAGAFLALGCADGVLLVESLGGGGFVAHAVTAPPEGRVGRLAGREAGGPLVGVHGDGILWIDPLTRTATPVALAAAPVAMRFAEGGETLLVLTVDGMLHALDPSSGALRASVAVAALSDGSEPGPSLTAWREHAFVVDPGARQIVVVHLHDLEVEARHDLPFTPQGAAVMAIEGAVGH